METSKSHWDKTGITSSGEYQQQKDTFVTILEHDKELLNLPFKKNKTDFDDSTEIVYSSDETLEIKEEIIEYQESAGQKYNKEYVSKLCNAAITETDNFSLNNELQSQNKEKTHKEKQELGNKFKCKKCARSYKWKWSLNQHQKLECGVSPCFKCESCGKSFKRNSTLKSHVQRVHHETNSKTSRTRHKCNMCTRSYALIYNLNQHQRSHKSEVKRQFICDYCGYIAKWKSHLSSHITTSHLQTPKIRLNCNKCSRSYVSISGLNRHTRLEHSSVIPYFICDYCEYKTNQKYSLTKHITLRHSQTSKSKLQCDKCSRSYTTLNSLTRHKCLEHS
ncbi:zinc finger protein 37 homolog [Belonocnema kinseyi]|uniref:zinc finger protein 37 homolog n=1 Tax=Belonocnema kinseyi TaxID=2817044 RepID=UPI00143D7038|nr:zinc finger protein 37 homolog [Belonocnema kinseyi]